MRVLFEARDLHERRALAEREALLGAAVGTLPPPARDEPRELLARRATPQWRSQVGPLERVEAEVPHAVSGESASVARRAERRGGGRDDAEDGPVGEPVAIGGRRGLLQHGLDPAVARREGLQHPRAAPDPLPGPGRRAPPRPVLDETGP